MDLEGKDESEARFARYIGGLASVIGHADRTNPFARLLRWPDDAVRAQER